MATVSPPVPGITVHFKVFDVDDPFDQLHSTMPDVSLIDANADGPDNRGGEALALPWTPPAATTDANGEARVTFIVSMQPGNNYRAGASVLLDASNQATQPIADAVNNKNPARPGDFEGYSVPLVWSKMLTVWRKLTIEVDSMDQESLDQTGPRESSEEWTRFVVAEVSPTIPAPVQVGVPDVGLTTVLGYRIPSGSPCSATYDNRWEGGAFAPQSGSPALPVVRNSCYTTSDNQVLTKFILFGDPGNVIGATINIRDDDFSPANGQSTQLPKTAVLTDGIRTAYRAAYIDIVEASPTINPRVLVPWASNLSLTDLTIDYNSGLIGFGTGVAGSWDLATNDAFWCRGLVVCYQAGDGDDIDPDPWETGSISQNVIIPGLAPYSAQHLSSLQNSANAVGGVTIKPLRLNVQALSTVYCETIRDKDIRDDVAKFWQYVAHEIGHSTFNQSGIQLSESAEHAEGALMSEGNDLQNLPPYQHFSAPTLVRFRSARKW